MKRFILPIFVLLIFVAESIFSLLLPREPFGMELYLVPRFLLIVIIFITVIIEPITGMLFGAVIGLCFDIVYTEILGVYMFALPVISYLISKLMRIIQVNVFSLILASLLSITVLELFLYGVNKLIKVTDMAWDPFLMARLVPTLLFNFLFVSIFAYPLRKWLVKLGTAEREV